MLQSERKVEYLGCWEELPGGLLRGFRTELKSKDPLRCVAKCFLHGHRVASVIEGKSCSCGAMPNPTPEAVEGDCSGGLLKAFRTGPVDEGGWMGCYSSAGEGTTVEMGSVASPHLCSHACLSQAMPFAALRRGVLCRCTLFAPVASAEVSPHLCDASCPARPSVSCGADKYFDYYRTGLDHLAKKECAGAGSLVEGKRLCPEELVLAEDFSTLNWEKWRPVVQISGQVIGTLPFLLLSFFFIPPL